MVQQTHWGIDKGKTLEGSQTACFCCWCPYSLKCRGSERSRTQQRMCDTTPTAPGTTASFLSAPVTPQAATASIRFCIEMALAIQGATGNKIRVKEKVSGLTCPKLMDYCINNLASIWPDATRFLRSSRARSALHSRRRAATSMYFYVLIMLLQPHNLSLTHITGIINTSLQYSETVRPISVTDLWVLMKVKRNAFNPSIPPTPTQMHLWPGFAMITWFLRVITIHNGLKVTNRSNHRCERKDSLNHYNRVHLLKHGLLLCKEWAAWKVSSVPAARAERGEQGLQRWSSSPFPLPAAPRAPAPLRTSSLRAQNTPFPCSAQGDFISRSTTQIAECNTYNDTNSYFKSPDPLFKLQDMILVTIQILV